MMKMKSLMKLRTNVHLFSEVSLIIKKLKVFTAEKVGDLFSSIQRYECEYTEINDFKKHVKLQFCLKKHNKNNVL